VAGVAGAVLAAGLLPGAWIGIGRRTAGIGAAGRCALGGWMGAGRGGGAAGRTVGSGWRGATGGAAGCGRTGCGAAARAVGAAGAWAAAGAGFTAGWPLWPWRSV
jgi:hypothetical protein